MIKINSDESDLTSRQTFACDNNSNLDDCIKSLKPKPVQNSDDRSHDSENIPETRKKHVLNNTYQFVTITLTIFYETSLLLVNWASDNLVVGENLA